MTYLSTLLASSSSRDSRSELLRQEFPIVTHALAWIRQLSARRNTIAVLSDLSDRQLRDIGIERADVASFVDEHFDALRRY